MMKRIIILLNLSVFLMLGCNNNKQESGTEIENPMSADNPEPGTDGPQITFDHDFYEFPGEIIEGERVPHSFTFTNTGNKELLVVDANAPCGCTIPSFSKEPIAPGEKGSIEVEFNSEGKVGRNQKTVTVTTNAIPNKKELSFVINVKAKS